MAVVVEVHDAMHYESRAIKSQLHSSESRLRSARSLKPTGLRPQQGQLMEREWRSLAQSTSMHSLSSSTPRLGDEDDGEASSSSSQVKRDARFQEMQAALAAFESIGGIAPARERAFYSALRTLLAEVAGESEGYVDITGSGRVLATIETKLAAAHKWFTRSKPSGPSTDPVVSAALASSISLDPAALTHLAGHGHSQGRLGSPPLGSRAGAGPSGPGLASLLSGGAKIGQNGGEEAMQSALATSSSSRRQFHGAFSRAAAAPGVGRGSGSGGAGVRAGQGGAPFPAASWQQKQMSRDMPLVMHPTVSLPSSAPHTNTLYAPGRLLRPHEIDEDERRAMHAAQAAALARERLANRHATLVASSAPFSAAAAAAGVPGGPEVAHGSGSGLAGAGMKAWMAGPMRAGLPGGALLALPVGRAGAADPAQLAAEEEEVAALRSKWTRMSAASAASEADVQRRVAVWALQRARLEEEMMRRLESLRFAAPTANDNPKFGADGSKMTHGSPPGVEGDEDDEEGDLMSAYLSPYARANADFAAAEADAAAGEHTVGGGGGVHAGARGALMRARHADVAAFDRHERAALVHALGGMIPPMAVAPEVIDRALRPVVDRPFLECIAKLPRPGAHLESRPSSLKVAAPKRKKRRPKSP